MEGNIERYQEIMERGHSAAWEQDWNNAAKYYQQALVEMPDDVKALMSLALALFELKDYKESLKYYLKVAKLSPDDSVPFEKASFIYEELDQKKYASEAAYRAAEVHLKNKNLKRAIDLWTRAISLMPENLRAHSRLALIYEKLGKKEKAVREYLHVASLMQHNGNVEKTIQSINRALQILPTSEEAHQALEMVRRGIMLPKPSKPHGGTGLLSFPVAEEIRQLEAPKETIEPEEQLDPVEKAHKQALSSLAEDFFQQSLSTDTEISVERHDFKDIVDGNAPSSVKDVDPEKVMMYLGKVVDLEMVEQFGEAAEELKKAFNAGLQSPAASFEMGYLMDKQGRQESAIRHLQHAYRDPAYALGARILMGKNLLLLDRVMDATMNYLEALKIADSSLVSDEQRVGIEQLYESMIESLPMETDDKRLEQICENIDDLLVRPDWQEHLKNIRAQLITISAGDTPMPIAEVLLEAKSSQTVNALTEIRMLAQRGLNRAAMEAAFFALEYAPIYLPIHMVIGELLYEEGKMEEAIDKYIMVAKFYIIRGETSRAIDLLKKVKELAPMSIDARTQLIDLYKEQGKLEAVINEYIDLGEVYYHMAELNNARKAYANALRIVNQVKMDVSWKVRLLHRMADIDIQSLDWRQAIQIFDQILRINPGDKKAIQNYIDLNFRLGQENEAVRALEKYVNYLHEKGDVEEAMSLVQELLEAKPENPALHKIMGRVYYWQGRDADGLRELDKAGELFLDVGDQVNGINVIKEIVKHNPPNVEEYRKLLQQLSL